VCVVLLLHGHNRRTLNKTIIIIIITTVVHSNSIPEAQMMPVLVIECSGQLDIHSKEILLIIVKSLISTVYLGCCSSSSFFLRPCAILNIHGWENLRLYLVHTS